MNILQFVDEPYDSGLGHYAATLAVALARRGHRSLFAGRAGTPPFEAARAAGLPVFAFVSAPKSLLPFRRFLDEHAVELINAHTGSAHTFAAAATRLRARAPKIVRTRGDARPLSRKPGGRWLFKRTGGFIAVNRKILEQYEAHYGELGAARGVIPQGIERPGAASAVPDNLKVGMLARLDPVKGHAVFMDAAALLGETHPDARFLCAGAEANLTVEGLYAESARRGLDRRVFHFTGRVPDPAKFMDACRVGVVPSTGSEALSRVVLEWMAAGRPVVAAAVGGIPELVRDGVTGFLVRPGDARALAGPLGRLLDNLELAREMGRAARAAYEKRYTPDAFAQVTEELYERVA